MTELDRYKEAYTVAMEYLSDFATSYKQAHQDCHAILNPPPATEEVEETVGWVNVYRKNAGSVRIGVFTYKTKDLADDAACGCDDERIACQEVKVKVTRPVPQKVERSAVAEDVLVGEGSDGTSIWPHGAPLVGDADWGSIIGKRVKMTLTWEE